MDTAFVDFLNHGHLPFVGRDRELERLVGFWRGGTGTDHAELRVMLLVGEAGSGKSRLIEEMIAGVEQPGGAVVHCKLRPEGATSLGSLICQAFDRSTSARTFAFREGDTIGNAISGLRRLCSLRRTLLVIEDVHLLAGEPLRELALLLSALADEPLALLAASRPVEEMPRPLLEGYLAGEIVLEGLGRDEIGEVWHSLFTVDPPDELLDLLATGTHGNAFALRSALRGGVRSGLIGSGEHGIVQLEIDVGRFRQTVERSSRGLVDGTIAALLPEELDAVRRLAQLGEIFSHSAARLVLASTPSSDPPVDVERLLDTLIFKGVIAHSTTPATPLNTSGDPDQPLAFTHSLLHDSVMRSTVSNDETVQTIILEGLPLYTTLPFRRLSSRTTLPPASREDVIATVTQLCAIALDLDGSANWVQAPDVLNAAERLAELVTPELDPVDAEELNLLVGIHSLQLRRRISADDGGEFHRDTLGLYSRSQRMTTPAMRLLHLDVLRLLISHATLVLHDADAVSYIDEGLAVIADDPGLGVTHPGIRFLSASCDYAAHNIVLHHSLLLRLERVITTLPPSTEGDIEEQRRTGIAANFLLLTDSPEMLERRYREEREICALAPADRVEVHETRMQFLLRVGECHRLRDELPPLIERLGQLGMTRRASSRLIDLMTVEVLTGASFDRFVSFLRGERGNVGARLLYLALLRNDLPSARALVEEFTGAESPIHASKRLLHALRENRLDDAVQSAGDMLPGNDILHELVLNALSIRSDGDIRELAPPLLVPPLTLFDFTGIYAALRLVDIAEAMGRVTIDREFGAVLRGSVEACAIWFADRSLDVLLVAHLDCHGHLLDEAELKRWRSCAEGIAVERRRVYLAEGGDRLRITMLDTITVQHPGGEGTRVRGGRNQTVLGLLVAGAMLKTPMDRGTFLQLATGIELDQERARKSWNIAALRLREVIGRDALVADDEVPHLDLSTVHVDLLEVWREMAAVESAVRNGLMVAARERLLGVITAAAGRIPFPTLYDELFESLRDEFGVRMRTLLVQLVRAHGEAEDGAGAEELLRAWIARVPDDEEIVEMLIEQLRGEQRGSEAVVVRTRAESAI